MSSPRLLEGWKTNPVSDQRSIRIPCAQELPRNNVKSRSAARRSSVMPKAMSSALQRVDRTKLTKRYSMDETSVSNTQKVTMFDDLRKYYDHVTDEIKNERDYDPSLYTDQALLQRDSLRFDEDIRGILGKIYKLTDVDSNGKIEKEEYIQLNLCLQRMVVGVLPMDQALNIAAAEWEFDRCGHTFLNPERLILSFFQLADIWTHDISKESYLKFLVGVYENISITDSINGESIVRFRNLDEIKVRKKTKAKHVTRTERYAKVQLAASMRRRSVDKTVATIYTQRHFLENIMKQQNEDGTWCMTQETAALLGIAFNPNLKSNDLTKLALKEIHRIGDEVLEKGKRHHARRQSFLWSEGVAKAEHQMAKLGPRRSRLPSNASSASDVGRALIEELKTMEMKSVETKGTENGAFVVDENDGMVATNDGAAIPKGTTNDLKNKSSVLSDRLSQESFQKIGSISKNSYGPNEMFQQYAMMIHHARRRRQQQLLAAGKLVDCPNQPKKMSYYEVEFLPQYEHSSVPNTRSRLHKHLKNGKLLGGSPGSCDRAQPLLPSDSIDGEILDFDFEPNTILATIKNLQRSNSVPIVDRDREDQQYTMGLLGKSAIAKSWDQISPLSNVDAIMAKNRAAMKLQASSHAPVARKSTHNKSIVSQLYAGNVVNNVAYIHRHGNLSKDLTPVKNRISKKKTKRLKLAVTSKTIARPTKKLTRVSSVPTMSPAVIEFRPRLSDKATHTTPLQRPSSALPERKPNPRAVRPLSAPPRRHVVAVPTTGSKKTLQRPRSGLPETHKGPKLAHTIAQKMRPKSAPRKLRYMRYNWPLQFPEKLIQPRPEE